MRSHWPSLSSHARGSQGSSPGAIHFLEPKCFSSASPCFTWQSTQSRLRLSPARSLAPHPPRTVCLRKLLDWKAPIRPKPSPSTSESSATIRTQQQAAKPLATSKYYEDPNAPRKSPCHHSRSQSSFPLRRADLRPRHFPSFKNQFAIPAFAFFPVSFRFLSIQLPCFPIKLPISTPDFPQIALNLAIFRIQIGLPL